MVIRCSRARTTQRAITISVSTIAKPEKMAPATKYGGKIVVCQPGSDRGREVERHDGVHREHQRRREAGQDQVGLLVVAPVAGRAAPAEASSAVDVLARTSLVARSRSVARSGTRPTYQNSSRDRGVGADREHVPEQRAAEVRPHAHLVRDREQPVRRATDGRCGTAGRCRAQARRRSSSLRRTRLMRRAPLLPEQEQDGGDQRAGVADTDPEDEVGDVPGPADRLVVAPDADAV